MDSGSKAAILGLTLETSPHDLFCAIMEGVCYEMRINLEKLREAGVAIHTLHATGGCASNRVWTQMKADVLGIPVTALQTAEAGGTGAAMLAGVASGAFENLRAAAAQMIRVREVFSPRQPQHEAYSSVFPAVRGAVSGGQTPDGRAVKKRTNERRVDTMDRQYQRYLGMQEQLFGVRRMRIEEGKAKGSTVLQVRSGGGLQLDILPDTGLDIGQLSYRGVNMNYMSKNGYDGPAAFLPYENEFLHTFPGGMLYTCGLRSTGPANRDGDEWFPLHGRIHGASAVNISTTVEEDTIVIAGTLRETALFGPVLELKRTIRVPLFQGRVRIEDSITNATPKAEEMMLLYHINFGYPMLSEDARLNLPEDRKTQGRNDWAMQFLGGETQFSKPVDNEPERVYFHHMQNKAVALENDALGISASLRWSGDTLPILVQWRSMATGDYALGLEPSNSYIMGRHAERENGTLPVIQGYETIQTFVELSFSDITK